MGWINALRAQRLFGCSACHSVKGASVQRPTLDTSHPGHPCTEINPFMGLWPWKAPRFHARVSRLFGVKGSKVSAVRHAPRPARQHGQPCWGCDPELTVGSELLNVPKQGFCSDWTIPVDHLEMPGSTRCERNPVPSTSVFVTACHKGVSDKVKHAFRMFTTAPQFPCWQLWAWKFPGPAEKALFPKTIWCCKAKGLKSTYRAYGPSASEGRSPFCYSSRPAGR